MDRTNTIRVGTRGSQLARIQTEHVVTLLRRALPELVVDIAVIRTAGDEDPKRQPARLTGTGIFTRAIEQALLDGRIDIAVHSLKDLPTECPSGLCLGAIPTRENPWDALVGCPLNRIADGKRIGTSSLRRAAQLRRAFPAARVVPLRGNLDTRLEHIRAGRADAAVLAAAGLRRLGKADRIAYLFTAETMLPAPGQGALAVQVREDNGTVRDLVHKIHCAVDAACVGAERAFLAALHAGCRTPVAALASIEHGELTLHGRVLSIDGTRCVEAKATGTPAESVELGRELARKLLAAGAQKILQDVRAEVEHGHI